MSKLAARVVVLTLALPGTAHADSDLCAVLS
jgi:hypothetical protein